MKKTIVLLSTVCLLCSCVSTKKYNKMMKDNADCSEKLSALQMKNTENESKISSLNEQLENCNKNLSLQTKTNEKINNDIKSYVKQNNELRQQLSVSNSKINEILKDKSSNLQQLNNELYQKEMELNQKEKNLDSLKQEYTQNQEQMKKMNAQLTKKDKELKNIQNKLKDALLGFKDKGLTIETKHGKVYVSMEEKLLFSSGSWQVSKDGIKALQEIAVVLGNNPDIDIMVEGHTDNVPLVGKNQVKDNWDLSVMRATSITKTLLDNTGISPTRILPCGRSEYMPLVDNKTPEHRAKNRRTEIILSPKVSELLEILN